MQLKAFVKMCAGLLFLFFFIRKRTEGAKCLQTLCNISFDSLSVSYSFAVIWCACLFHPVGSVSFIPSYSCAILSMVYPRFVCNYKKLLCILRLDQFISSHLHTHTHILCDWLYLVMCSCGLLNWIELPVSWCRCQCCIVINVAGLLTHCLVYKEFFFLYICIHLNRDKSS